MKLLSKLSLCAVMILLTASCSKEAKAEKKLGPAETVTHISQSIVDNKPGEIWLMLPKSYRKDINSIAHMIGDKMPASLWDESFTLVGRLGKVLSDKKDILLQLASENLPPNQTKEDVAFAIESMGKMFTELAKSDISKVEKLKSIDLGEVADSSFTEIMKILNNDKMKKIFNSNPQTNGIFFDSFAKVKAELISEAGNSAKIKITDPNGKVEEVELTKVEGKWLPKKIVDEFKKGITEAKKELAASLEKIPEMQMGVDMGLDMVGGVISALEAANSVEDIKNSLSSLPINPMSMIGSFGNTRGKASEAKEKSNLRQIGVAIAIHYSDGGDAKFEGTFKQFKEELSKIDFDLNNYVILFGKGDEYVGASDIVMVSEKPDPAKDGVNVVFQDGHVEKIMGSFKTVDDIKKAVIAQGHQLKYKE